MDLVWKLFIICFEKPDLLFVHCVLRLNNYDCSLIAISVKSSLKRLYSIHLGLGLPNTFDYKNIVNKLIIIYPF